MAKILTKQIQQINSACSNGWRLDTQYVLLHGEKRLIQQIHLDNENYLEFALQYNGENQITLYISKYNHKPNDIFAVSEGLGKRKILDTKSQKRKAIKELIAYTDELDNNKLMEINEQTPVSSGMGIFVPSDPF